MRRLRLPTCRTFGLGDHNSNKPGSSRCGGSAAFGERAFPRIGRCERRRASQRATRPAGIRRSRPQPARQPASPPPAGPPPGQPAAGQPAHRVLPTTYSPAAVEASRYEQWVADGVFTADPGSGKTPYAIVIPPPNVTGSLHMGHAFQHTLMDALVRRRRMQGYDALWVPGTDHAGIATQNVVERVLAHEGKSRQDLGREGFVERVWQWRAEYGDKILGQMRRLGEGVDWTRERFTMDEGLSRAVRTIFKRLYDDDLIYRAERIINWCPRCQTALSDIEVEHREIEGELVSISYGPVTRGHHPGGDDARRHRRRGASRRRALPPPRRARSGAAADQSPHPGHRRRSGRRVVRDGCGEGHPRPRPERLRDRAAPRPARRGHDGRARQHHRPRPIPGARPFRGPARGGGRAARAGAPGRRAPPLPALGGALFPVRDDRRAAAVAAMVRPGRPAGQTGRRRGAPRRHRVLPAGDGPALFRLGRLDARLVHQPAAVVGSPDPGLVWPGRANRGPRPRRRRARRRGLAAGR